jgi:hypothetical protein
VKRFVFQRELKVVVTHVALLWRRHELIGERMTLVEDHQPNRRKRQRGPRYEPDNWL